MANAGGITFGAAKAALATVTDNGVGTTDARVMLRANEATKALLDELIPVGGMITFDIAGIVSPEDLSAGTQLWLPTSMENAIEVEVLAPGTVHSSLDVTQGWTDQLVNNAAYADASFAHDNPLVDLFFYPDNANVNRRLYDYPGLSAGAIVRVTGAKRYLPITGDGSFLIIQNVRALKLMILSIEREENNAFDESAKYKTAAVELLQKEVRKHQLDPRNTMKRKAAYQNDLVIYAADTLGRTRARLALELPGFLMRGKSEITYLINRALEALVRRENLLRIAARWDIHGTATEIEFDLPVNVAAATLTDACPGSLAAGDYDIIKRMCQFFVHAEAPIPDATTYGQNAAQISAQMETEVYALLEARLTEALEFRRRTTYEAVLADANRLTMSYRVARLALDLPNGLKMSRAEILRYANSAEQRLMERGKWKDTIHECTAVLTNGFVLYPRDVETILAATLNGSPIRIRGRFFEFHENTNGEFDCDDNCAQLLIDQGEEYSATDKSVRRKYKLLTGGSEGATVRALVKRRWIPKELDDIVVIQNYEAIRLMVMGIIQPEAAAFLTQAVDILQKELQEYLAGIMPHVQVQVKGMRRIRMLR